MPRRKWRPQDGDRIILVLGQTGSGKSTFINTALASGVATVGHKLDSCTAIVQPYSTKDPQDSSRRVVLVDTPGFDDSEMISDSVIMGIIADWLKYECGLRTPVAGIIVLHEIPQRVQPHGVIDNICHSGASLNVILATSKWDLIDASSHHETILSSKYPTLALHRFPCTHNSAWTIINALRAEDSMEGRLIRERLLKIRELAKNSRSETNHDPGFFKAMRKRLVGNT